MTVNELICLLNECDPDAEVRIMCQEGYPFENGVKGVAIREEFAGEECECFDRRIVDPHEEGCPAADEPEYGDGLQPNDVFIVEGRQERYGSKKAWEMVRGW